MGVDIASGYDDTRRRLSLAWHTYGPPNYGLPVLQGLRVRYLQLSDAQFRSTRGRRKPASSLYSAILDATCRIGSSRTFRATSAAASNPTFCSQRNTTSDSLEETDLTRTFSSSSDERLNHQLVACARCGLQYVSPRLRADAVLEGIRARLRRAVRLSGAGP